MRSVNIADLKNNLSRYLSEVRRGAEVLVKDRNKPIARIVPLAVGRDDQSELIELVAEGAARLPRSVDPLPRSFWKEPLPKAAIDLIDLIRKDRDAS
jgi:prevent-host-death family protein